MHKFQVVQGRVIMFGYTNTQNIKNMTTFNNNDPERHHSLADNSNCYLNNLSFEEDPIEQFLNEEAFLDRHSPSKPIQQSNDLTVPHLPQNHPNAPSIHETQHSPRKKSIFHNFQKHLITLIKKSIALPAPELAADTQALLPYQLWAAFKRTRSFNKKVLHMVFGICESGKLEEELLRLAEEFPEFRQVLEENSASEVANAQEVIREEVIKQSSAMDRATLQGSCNVNRFQEFYQYFQSFLCELASGPMAKRMTKTRKYVVVERLKNKQKSQ